MTSPVVRKWIVIWVLMVTCIFSSGCNKLNDKPGGEYLNLALAGMAGSDGVTFEGATALLRGTAGTPFASVYYGGNVEDHNKVTLYTLLPDSKPSKAAPTSNIKEASNTTGKPSYFSKMEKKEGHWQVLSETATQEDNPLPRLNPLHQLEELTGLNKTVTEEGGAGRGVRVLRIELSPDEAHKQLVDQLKQEMSALRTLGQTKEDNKLQLKKALDTFWEKKNAELKSKLDQAQVKTIYHLNVDSRRNLPKRLSMTRTISYPGDAQNALSETYVSQVDFYGYR